MISLTIIRVGSGSEEQSSTRYHDNSEDVPGHTIEEPAMNCAWCGPVGEESHGICDACIRRYFGVDAANIHAEIASETTVQKDAT